MNILSKIALPLITTLILTACGSSSQKAVTENPTVTPTEQAAVHHIQPEDVAEYIENFTNQYAEVELQIDGVIYDISLVDLDFKSNRIYAKYEKGFLYWGFDFDEGEPLNEIVVLETEIEDYEEALGNGNLYQRGSSITIDFDEDNAIYSGNLVGLGTENQTVRLVINESFFGSGNSTLTVDGTTAKLHGEVGSLTYIQIRDLINNHPEVTTILLQYVPGSMNDEINMHTGRLIRNAQLTTKVETTSIIASGGVDLYASGFTREYSEGAFIGVHSWCCGEDNKPANELGEDHPDHGAQLTYFREMLGAELGPEFYFYTINAAAFDTVHNMTKNELDKYLLVQ